MSRSARSWVEGGCPSSSGAGALYVGPGWDVAVLGLALFLRGEPVGDPVAWEGTPEVQRYSAATIDAW